MYQCLRYANWLLTYCGLKPKTNKILRHLSLIFPVYLDTCLIFDSQSETSGDAKFSNFLAFYGQDPKEPQSVIIHWKAVDQ